MHIEITSLERDFSDGVNLIMLVGLLEDFFVPLHYYQLSPKTEEDKIRNVKFAFELLADSGIRAKNRPSDIVRGDLKVRHLMLIVGVHCSNL